MIDLLLVDGDLSLDSAGDFQLVTGKKQSMQAVKITIGTNRGEWFFDLRFGFPWLKMFEQRADDEEIRTALRDIIIARRDVKDANISILRDAAARVVRIDAVVTLRNGAIITDTVEV